MSSTNLQTLNLSENTIDPIGIAKLSFGLTNCNELLKFDILGTALNLVDLQHLTTKVF